jgi:hypothetical protein
VRHGERGEDGSDTYKLLTREMEREERATGEAAEVRQGERGRTI